MALMMLMTFMVVLMAAFTIVIDGRVNRIKSINSSFDSNEQQYQEIPKSIK